MRWLALTNNFVFIFMFFSFSIVSHVFFFSLWLKCRVWYIMLNLLDFGSFDLSLDPSPQRHTYTNTCSSGDLLWKCSFHHLCGLQKWQSYKNTQSWGRLPEQSLCNTCSQQAERVETRLWGGLGRIWATAEHQSHCGIGSTLSIWRLQPVKVSVLLMPDCKSSSPRFIFSLTVLVSGRILQCIFCCEVTAEKKALPGKSAGSSETGRHSVYSYLIPFVHLT